MEWMVRGQRGRCLGWLLFWLTGLAWAEPLPRLVVQNGHAGAVEAVAWSPDARLIASGGRDRNVKLWDAARGRLLRTLSGHDGEVLSVTFSADGATLLSSAASFTQTVKVWDVASGTLLRSIDHAGDTMALTRDGRTLVAGGAQHVLNVIELASGKQLHALKGHTDGIVAVAVSPDGKLAASSSRDQTVILWNIQSGKALHTLRGIGELTEALAFSTRASQLVTGGSDRTLRVWDTTSGKLVRTIGGMEDAIVTLALSADGRSVAAGGGSTVRLWDLQSGKPQRALVQQDNVMLQKMVTAIAFAPSGNALVAGHDGVRLDDAMLRVWDGSSGMLSRTMTGTADSVNRIAWSPDGRQLVAAGWDGTLDWWDLARGQARREEGIGGIYAAAFSADGKRFVHGKQKDIVVIDPRAGKQLRTLRGHERTVRALAFPADGALLASGSEDGSIRLWDAETGAQLRVLKGHKGYVQALAFSGDGKILASGGEDEMIRLWNPVDGALLATLKGYGGWVNALAFSPNNAYLAAATYSKGVQVWDWVLADIVLTLDGHGGSVNDVAFSPDNAMLASAGSDQTVRLWAMAKGRPLHRLEGHQGPVNSVRFSPDGKFLVSGSADNSMRLWRPGDGAHLASLVAFTDATWVVADPSGRFDTADLEDMRGLHWVLPADPRTAVPVDLFIGDYYEPRLLARLLKGEAFAPLRALDSLDRTQPVVTIAAIEAEAGGKSVTVTVQVDSPKGSKAGAQDLKLFRSGRLVAAVPEALKRDAKGRATLTFPGILLGQPPFDGKLEFSAYAFNGDRVKSSTARRTYAIDVGTLPPPPKRRAYLVVIGVNAYDNPLLDLKFAANDAASLQQTLEARLRARATFEDVVTVPLVSRQTIAQAGPVGAASKENIRTVLALLAGQPVDPALRARIPNADKLRRATPDDLVFLSFAGHGFYEPGEDFYLLPTDIGPGKTRQPTDAVLAASISSEELTQWLRPVDGGEMALVIDACHSGAAVGENFKPGPMGSRGLGQLAFDKSMLVLAATQADNVALEAEELEHGYLSYALVQEGLLARRADYQPQDGRVTLNEWLGFAAQRVPYLALEVDAGAFARGTGPTLKAIKRNLADDAPSTLADDVQQPSLFEFKRRKASAELVVQ